MPADDGTYTRCNRIKIQGVDVMDHIEPGLFDIEKLGFRQSLGPLFLVDIAPNGNQRRYLPQSFKHSWVTNVSGVNN